MSVTINSDKNLKDVSAFNSNAESITITAGAVLTITETPAYLLGDININNGEVLIDGTNITAGNNINIVGSGGLADGSNDKRIAVNGQGKLTVRGAWYDLGTTDGTDDQAIDVGTYWDNEYIGTIPMIQVETGRRISYDASSGVAPKAGDMLYLLTDRLVFGKIHSVGADYVVVWALSGVVPDNASIGIRSIVDNMGPDFQLSWTATANGADVKEAGVYTEFGNARANGNDYRSRFGNGLGGLVFHHALYGTTLTMAGADGGFVPPSGCNIRVPNVNINTSSSAEFDAGNAYRELPNTDENDLWELECSAGGIIDMEICNIGNAVFEDPSAFSWSTKYVGVIINMGSSICGSRMTFEHCLVCQDTESNAISSSSFGYIQDTIQGADVKFCTIVKPINRSLRFGASTSQQINYEDCIYMGGGTEDTLSEVFRCYSVKDWKIIRCQAYSAGGSTGYAAPGSLIYASSASEVVIKEFLFTCTTDYTPQSSESDVMIFKACNDIVIEGIDVIGNGHPGNYYINFGDVVGAKVRGIGMIDDKLMRGTNAEYLVGCVGLTTDIDIARCWADEGGHEEVVVTATTQKNIVVQNCSGKYASVFKPYQGDTIRFKGVHGGSGDFGNATNGVEDLYKGSYGYNFHDLFYSDTTGNIALLHITPSPTDSEVTILAGNPLFYKDGDLDMVNGDELVFEQKYVMKGHIACTGDFTTAISDATRNDDEFGSNIALSFQYKLLGQDWNGTWLDLRTPANLTDIPDMRAGVSFKIKYTASGSKTSMAGLLIETTTSLQAQKDNMYAVDQDGIYLAYDGAIVDSNELPRVVCNGDMTIYISDVDFKGSIEAVGGSVVTVLGINNGKTYDATLVGDVTLGDGLVPSSNYTVSSGVITLDTGTTESGLKGLRGMAEVDYSQSGSKLTYNIKGLFNLKGTLSIDPAVEALEFTDETTGWPKLMISDDSTLTVGSVTTSGDESVYSLGRWLTTTHQGSSAWDGSQLSVYTDTDATVNLYGGSMSVAAPIRIAAAVNCLAQDIILQPTLNQYARILMTNYGTIGNCSVFNNGFNMGSIANLGSNIRIINARNVGIHQGGLNIFPLPAGFVIKQYDYVIGGALYPWGSAYWTAMNCKRGGEIAVSSGFSSDGEALINVAQALEFKITDLSGSPIENAIARTHDYVNGETATIYGHDLSTVNTYEEISDSNGIAMFDKILLKSVHNNKVDGVTGGQVTNYRTQANDGSDLFDFTVYSYNHGVFSLPAHLVRSSGVQYDNVTLLPDFSLTEQDKSVVDEYTVIDTASKVYDLCKAYLYDHYLGESTTMVAKDGNEIKVGATDFTINGSTAIPINVVGNNIQVAATEFKGSLTSTSGVLTIANGATLSNCVVDGDLHILTGLDTFPTQEPQIESNIELVKVNDNDYWTNSTTCLLPIDTPTEGNLLIATMAIDKSSGGGIDIDGWTLVNEKDGASSSFIQYSKISDGTETDVTGKWNTSHDVVGYVEEFTGFGGTPTVTAVHANYQDTAELSISTGTVAQCEKPNALIHACYASDTQSNLDGEPSMSNGFTAEPVVSHSNAGVCTAYKVVDVATDGETTFTFGSGNGDQMSAGILMIEDTFEQTEILPDEIEDPMDLVLDFNNVTVTGLVYNDSPDNKVTINLTGSATANNPGTGGGEVDIQIPKLTYTIKGIPTGAEYRLYVKDPLEGVIGTTELIGSESHTGGDVVYTTEAENDVVLQVIFDGYIEYQYEDTIGVVSKDVKVKLIRDTNI